MSMHPTFMIYWLASYSETLLKSRLLLILPSDYEALLSKLVNHRALWISKPLWLSCFFCSHSTLWLFPNSLVLRRWVAFSLSENTHLASRTEWAPGPRPNLISLLSHIGMIIAAEIKATWDGRPTVNMEVNRGKNPSATGEGNFRSTETCTDQIPSDILALGATTSTRKIIFRV